MRVRCARSDRVYCWPIYSNEEAITKLSPGGGFPGGGFPAGAVVENLPANAGDTGSSPGLGRSHMPRSNWAREPQLLSLRVWSLCPATREAATIPFHKALATWTFRRVLKPTASPFLSLGLSRTYMCANKETSRGASLVAQWLRVCLPMQGTRVRALVWEDPTCRGATGPVSHNYWA
ncbi:hypothetical protein J1605_002852 [Eschrichtius robustus]|uniref:Uncharacterized protein n=1 Tax=Eschrichtius robustus TaxID=9764 RepID=A0AB34HSR2_ESCRO|nr:hypothetical protein J1605_002852 [Eschrichtius robustus]